MGYGNGIVPHVASYVAAIFFLATYTDDAVKQDKKTNGINNTQCPNLRH